MLVQVHEVNEETMETTPIGAPEALVNLIDDADERETVRGELERAGRCWYDGGTGGMKYLSRVGGR